MVFVRNLSVFLVFFSIGVMPSAVFAQSYYFKRVVSTDFVVGVGKKKITDSINEEYYSDGKMMKVTEKETGKMRIFDADERAIYEIDTQKKTYTELSFPDKNMIEDKEKAQKSMVEPQRNLGMQAARQRMLGTSTTMDVAQKSLMQQMMMQQQTRMLSQSKVQKEVEQNTPILLKWTKKSKMINGYLCTRFKITKGQKRILEGWVTNQTGPQNFYSDFSSCIKGLLFKIEVITELKKVKGFPMLERYKIQTGQYAGSMQMAQVSQIENRLIASSEFDIPRGFRLEGTPLEADDEDDDW